MQVRVRTSYLFGCAALIGMFILVAAPAFADTSVTGGGDVIELTASQRASQNPTSHMSSGSANSSSSNSAPPCTPGAILDPQLQYDPTTQQLCVYIGSICGDPNSTEGLNSETQTFLLLRQHPLCPSSPARIAPPAPTPAQVALLIWQTQVPLPHPSPYIAPGYAITGKRAYLEIRDSPSLAPQHFSELGYDI